MYDAMHLYSLVNKLTVDELLSIRELVSMAKLRRFVKPVVPSAGEPPVWFYIGERSDHVVVPGLFCTCKHFIIKTMCERVERYCNHILAQKIAWEKKWYREIRVTRYELYIIVEEIIEYGRSRMLRKKIYSGRL